MAGRDVLRGKDDDSEAGGSAAMRFNKVVCTGGSGRLGRYVVDRLKETRG
jgi:hypothetical protein